MISRYERPMPLTPERAHQFVVLDNVTAQVPLIELAKDGKRKCVRIWTAYNYDKRCGTYTAVYFNGLVVTATVYPSGRKVEKINRPRD